VARRKKKVSPLPSNTLTLLMMADHAAGDDIFVYTGGRAPQHVVNAIIDESIDAIDNHAFYVNPYQQNMEFNLRSVNCHEGLLKVGGWGFCYCRYLQCVKMPGVKIIGRFAFYGCNRLVDVELDKLETIGENAFAVCTSMKQVKLPKIETIGECAFIHSGVQDAEFGEDLETIGSGAFRGSKLRRIAIPLKDGMFQFYDRDGNYTQFRECYNLTTVDLVGGIHKTVASLHLESWRNEMNAEIQRINQILPATAHVKKTDEIRQWMQSVSSKIDHYKAEHRASVKEATTLLELALWKAKLTGFKVEDNNMGPGEKQAAKKPKIDDEARRKEARITSGADIIIKNVLPYLKME
jgi:hypothetical protein